MPVIAGMSFLLAKFKSERFLPNISFLTRAASSGASWPSTSSFRTLIECCGKRNAKTAFLLLAGLPPLILPLAAIEIQVSHNRNSSYACGTAVFINERLLIIFHHLEVAMNSISNVSIRAIPETQTGLHPLKAIALFCGLVLGAALCVATYGLDLSAGFF